MVQPGSGFWDLAGNVVQVSRNGKIGSKMPGWDVDLRRTRPPPIPVPDGVVMPARFRWAVPVIAVVALGVAPALTTSAAHAASKDDTPVKLTPKGEHEDGSDEASFDKLRDAYYWSRLLAGDDQLTIGQAAQLRQQASTNASGIQSETVKGKPRGGTWQQVGPNPIVQVARTSNTYAAMSGRVGALAIRGDGTLILGAAQGGVWTYDPSGGGTWTSRTKDADTQSVGALAVAPSNDSIVYMGSGEGALSGDSYYGDGVYRSKDGGVTWKHVSTLFTGQATSALAVDPTNPDHVYAATLRGRGGNHRTSAPSEQPYGVWESKDGGQNWNLLKGTRDELHGATDLVIDPQQPNRLWASFWGDAIYTSNDSGRTWTSALGNLPKGNFLEGGTRFSLGIAHPAGAANPTLYTGFDYFDSSDVYHQATVYKSVDGGTTWTTSTGSPTTGPDSIVGYCGTQCFYDNVVKPDPNNPNTVYVLGSYGYGNSPAVRRRLPIHRRRRALAEPRVRPAPRLPRHRLPAHRHQARRDRQRRRRLAVNQPRRPPDRRPTVHRRLAGPERAGQPDDRGPDPRHRPADRPVHVSRNGSATSPASTGAEPRTTAHYASRWPTTAGSTRPAVTAAR